MLWRSPFSTLPLAWKAPLLAAALVIAVALVVSKVVLDRLQSDQDAALRDLTGAYMDGVSASVLPATVRGDVWEAFDALDRARGRYSGLKVNYSVVADTSDRIIAASDPFRFPVLTDLPAGVAREFPKGNGLVMEDGKGLAWASRTLAEEGVAVGRILTEIDVSDLLRVRGQVLWTLIAVNATLAFGFAVVGWYAIKRMLRPLSVVGEHIERVRAGDMQPITGPESRRVSPEFERLFRHFNAMARAVNEREALTSRIAAQERYALIGKLASAMAHEVNNPLGGLFNALDTMKRHGDDPKVREPTLDLLGRGLTHIRNIVGSTLITHRGAAPGRSLKAVDLDDLRLLVEPEAARKRITLDWINDVSGVVEVDAEAVRQATLNLLINACAASRTGGTVRLRAFLAERSLVVGVGDQGPGLPQAIEKFLLLAPDESTTLEGGLGLWVVRRLVKDAGGTITIRRRSGFATIVRIAWPIGDVESEPAGAIAAEETLHV
jgi:signal transduction histidine kinase